MLRGTGRWKDASNDDKLRFLRDIVERWRSRLNLHAWKLHVQLENSQPSDLTCDAESFPDWRYIQVLIKVYPNMWHAAVSDEEREHEMVHELVHAVVDPLARTLKDARDGVHITNETYRSAGERCTSDVTAIIWQAYRGQVPGTTDVA